MTALAQSLLEQVLALPDADRQRIADALRRSLPLPQDDPPDDPAEVEKAWAEEIVRRVEDIDQGRVRTIPADQALRDIRTMLADRRNVR